MNTFCCNLLLVAALTCAAAGAQASSAPVGGRDVPTLKDWPTGRLLNSSDKDNADVILLTAADSAKRIKCRNAMATADNIACQRRFGHAPTVYRRDQVLSILRPGKNAFVSDMVALGVYAGGVGVGVYYLVGVSLSAAVPVAIVGAFVLAGSYACTGFADVTRPEEWLYQQPGTALTGTGQVSI